MSRYKNIQNVTNASEKYSAILKSKNLNFIRHKNIYDFSTIINNMKNPNIKVTVYNWSKNDKLYTVSQNFYGSPEYSWLILLTNSLKSEFDLYDGIDILIYYPLEILLRNT